ncbi:hypothetical protein AAC03nite_34390 [Alicyclobacillus acidoterrestris]|nr:hypothetical protein AAC03nite_34390 [Alicyclobacillus acidoterrestris]
MRGDRRMMFLVPALLYATSNPVILSYLAVGTSVGAKVVLGATVGLIVAHGMGF